MESTLPPDEQLIENYSAPIVVIAAEALTAPALVYITSLSAAGVPKVSKADADLASVVGQVALFVVVSDIANGETGVAFKRSIVRGTADVALNTNGAAVGDPVYLSATAGGWTLTRPNTNGLGGSSITAQIVGRVMVASATVGQIQFDLASDGPTQGAAIKGTLRFALIAGGAAGAFTLTGIASGDRIVAVIANDDTSGVDTNLTTEFTITGADAITNAGGTASTGKHLEIWWEDRT